MKATAAPSRRSFDASASTTRHSARSHEIVHDIDLKDGKFGREDAVGVERVLAAIASAYSDDALRLQRGAALFDELYALAAKEIARAALVFNPTS